VVGVKVKLGNSRSKAKKFGSSDQDIAGGKFSGVLRPG